MLPNKTMISVALVIMLLMTEPSMNQNVKAFDINDVKLSSFSHSVITNITLSMKIIELQTKITLKEKVTVNQQQNVVELQSYAQEKTNGIEFISGYDNIRNDCIIVPIVNYYNALMKENGSNNTMTYQEADITFDSVSINFTNVLLITNPNIKITSFYYKIGTNT